MSVSPIERKISHVVSTFAILEDVDSGQVLELFDVPGRI
jgi:hypothetical protein